ncbi:hypothetical protein BG000_009280 [Podila horticola]|nr:hypothetical protein BG000_009280 [Podila horticola]
MVNSLLGTAYVSLIPNLFLHFVPANIQPGTMKTLVAFARGSKRQTKYEPGKKEQTPSTSTIKGSAYLNLLADASHNFTDGLAMAASFYASPTIGATTTVAVFFHEIPHEIGDYAMLIQSGFTKSMAMKAQFVTAIGAFLGTIVGIALEEWSRRPGSYDSEWTNTSVKASELVLPITAGGFLYIGSVGVIPDLLSLSGERSADLVQFSRETIAILTGVGLMAAIALNE